jgi:UDP-N-acetylmuramoylalanine--D-glutamate ligase
MRSVQGERIGVLGLARSGLAAARLALRRGARVYASDLGDTPATQAAADELRGLGAEVDLGTHEIRALADCDLIVLSPGIPPTAAILTEPALEHVPIVPEIDFAFEQLGSRIVAVTGTNGKTTVTALIAHLLRAAGRRAIAGGNIGTALSDVALQEPQPEIAVVEVSSFQLGIARSFAPSVGVLTNLSPDHLDWYPDVESYYADKARLFRNATRDSVWVLNGEDARARGLPGDAPGDRYYFRVDSALDPGERGGHFTDAGVLVLRLAEVDEPLVAASELMVLGRHNVANALAASIAARLTGADLESVRRGLRGFRPQPHRLEPVLDRGDVIWVNDSKATNLSATDVAIRSMDRPTILLLGGRHKGESYRALIPVMRDVVRQVIAFGEAGPLVADDLGGDYPVELVEGGFDEVVRRAAGLARPGDAVLLAPACSSYDMFRDYEERGERFAELANQVAE